jgi:hypothetical protein
MKININNAPGPNDPVLKILKEFAYVLAVPPRLIEGLLLLTVVPLTEIFNDWFRGKYFPKLWNNIN